MKAIKIKLFCLLVLCSIKGYSQINMVNNGSFEYGSSCNCYTESNGTTPDLRVYNWSVSGPKSNLSISDYPTSDWFLFPDCYSNGQVNGKFIKFLNYYQEYLPVPLYSKGVIGMFASENDWTEGIKTELKENLKPGSTYLMRMKIGLGLSSFSRVKGTYNIAIHFSKFFDDWTANPNTTNNVLWENAFNLQIDGSNLNSNNEFIPVQFYFTVPTYVKGGSSGYLKNLIIRQRNENFNAYNLTYAYIDDVELYEVSDYRCNNNWIIEDRIYEYHDLPIEASGEIIAGKNVLDNNSNGPVICDAKQDSAFGDSRVIYKAGKRIQLKDGFKVEKEAYFRAYLAPCGKEFFDPVADLGITDSVITICGDVERCLDLGTRKAYNMTYEWSSNDAAISALLTGISTMSQIKLCIPRNVPSGTYRLTYKVTNKDGAVAEKSLRIYINRSPFNSNPVMYHKDGTYSWGGYYFNGSKSHDKFWAKYEVFYSDEILMEVFSESGQLIDTKLFLVDRDFPRQILMERPRFEIEYYKEVPCGNYTFSFTLINKCSGVKTVYTEKTRYHCQFD